MPHVAEELAVKAETIINTVTQADYRTPQLHHLLHRQFTPQELIPSMTTENSALV